jgi:IPT/TIG domain/Glucose / Sorbosone dehydrogenase
VTQVRFGLILMPVADIKVINATAISVKAPASGFGVPVAVSVITPAGESNSATYTYVNSAPIAFTVEKLLDFATPTTVCFGPDGNLYVGSTSGQLGRFTLNDNYDKVVSSVISTIDPTRGIHSIAFDPLETAQLGNNINVYISTSRIFHLEPRNSFGNGINGKIQTVKGANLDIVTDIVTGLPVSELDHAVRASRHRSIRFANVVPFLNCFIVVSPTTSLQVNGIYFGDNGELYIAVGSNTNGGIPGELSASRLMRENYFSAAILLANLGQPGFNGFITYNAPIDGDPITGAGPKGVEVFGAGLRNPYGVLFHSNGKVYATENGPNPGFGDMATGCGVGQQIPDAYEVDELNLIKRGSYYGHPNFKRAVTDARQCTWRAASLPSGNGYTAPLMKLASSTDGIIEFESDHFNGQMRGDLILSKYTDGFFRVILSPDGETVNRSSDPAIPLVGDNGLALTQAPDGSLIDARYTTNNCYFFKPIEATSTTLDIKSVFPRRGSVAGGSKLWIFGVNFAGGTPVVTVGGKACTGVVLMSAKKIECTLPVGTVGNKDVVVTIGAKKDTFANGYRYITGKPLPVV